MRILTAASLIALFSIGVPARVGAQVATNAAPQAPDLGGSLTPAGGWTFTPSLAYGGTWDDNVLLRGQGDAPVADYQNAIQPSGSLVYAGRRNQFNLDYSGAFLLYRELTTLDAITQHANVSASRRLTTHITVLGRGSWTSSPTTELAGVPGLPEGVPFVLNGSRIFDSQGGFEVQFTKRLTVSTTAGFQSVSFNQDAGEGFVLQGGHSVGGTISAREALNARTSLTANYDVRFATVAETDIGGTTTTFPIENSSLGLERQLSQTLKVFGGMGVAHMGATDISPARTGPTWQVGGAEQIHRLWLSGSYNRSYIPAFSFGGTFDNESLTGLAKYDLTGRLFAQAATSWQRNEPLTEGALRLKSLWFSAQLGYAINRWAHLVAFYEAMNQVIDRPGGVVDRRRIGLQVITVKPLRIR